MYMYMNVCCVVFTVKLARTSSKDRVPHETSMLVQHGKGIVMCNIPTVSVYVSVHTCTCTCAATCTCKYITAEYMYMYVATCVYLYVYM